MIPGVEGLGGLSTGTPTYERTHPRDGLGPPSATSGAALGAQSGANSHDSHAPREHRSSGLARGGIPACASLWYMMKDAKERLKPSLRYINLCVLLLVALGVVVMELPQYFGLEAA